MSPQIEAQVLEMRRIHRSWGARRITFELGKAGVPQRRRCADLARRASAGR
jgi:hypothetical protein